MGYLYAFLFLIGMIMAASEGHWSVNVLGVILLILAYIGWGIMESKAEARKANLHREIRRHVCHRTDMYF